MMDVLFDNFINLTEESTHNLVIQNKFNCVSVCVLYAHAAVDGCKQSLLQKSRHCKVTFKIPLKKVHTSAKNHSKILKIKCSSCIQIAIN